MIIFEGADGVGKTTAAKATASHLGVPYIHSPGPYPERFAPTFAYHMSNPLGVVVYDRFFFSELVYGPILRGEVRLPGWFLEYAEKLWIPATRPLVVWCKTDYVTALRGLDSNEQLPGIRENLQQILSDYKTLMTEEIPLRYPDVWIMSHDWTKKPLDLDAIASWKHRREQGW